MAWIVNNKLSKKSPVRCFFRGKNNEVFTNFVNKGNSMWTASSCNPYLRVQVRRWTCPKPGHACLKQNGMNPLPLYQIYHVSLISTHFNMGH